MLYFTYNDQMKNSVLHINMKYAYSYSHFFIILCETVLLNILVLI